MSDEEEPGQSVAAALAKIRAQKAPPEIGAALAALRGGGGHQSPAAAAGRLPAIQKAGDEALGQAIEDEQPTYGQKALGGVAALAHDIPGAEAAQAGARSGLSQLLPLVGGKSQNYREALDDIHKAEASAPTAVRVANRLIGGTVGALTVPGSAAASGAAFGGASGLLDSDPDLTVSDRLKKGAFGAATGAASGKVGELAGTGLRAAFSKTAGAANKALKGAIKSADDIGFGATRAEAQAGGGTSNAAKELVNDPLFKPHIDELRASNTLTGDPNDDASLLLQLRNELSNKQGPVVQRITNAQAGQPIGERQSAVLQAMKDKIVSALGHTRTVEKPPVMFDAPASSFTHEPTIREDVAGPLKSTAFSLPERKGLGPFRAVEGRATAPSQTFDRETIVPASHGTAELQEPVARHVSFDRAEIQGPQTTGKPGFVLKGEAKPGVKIETPAMRVQTAPGETVNESPLTPSLPFAVQESKALRQQHDAFKVVRDAAKPISKGVDTPTKQLGKTDPESLRDAIGKMTPQEADAGTQALLARVKKIPIHPTINPATGFGVTKGLFRQNRLLPFLRQLDQASGASNPSSALNGAQLSQILQKLGIDLTPR